MDSKTGRTLMTLAGLALVVGFFLPWIDIGFGPGVSGFQVARVASRASLFHLVLLLVPIGGAAVTVLALTKSKHARLVSVLLGLALVGYGVVKTVQTFFATTGVGLWLVIAASIAALLVPLLTRPERE